MTMKEFVMDYSITNKTADSEDTLYIEGIANTGELDLVGDRLSQEALESIVAQAPNRNLHMNHDHEFSGILGTIVESELRDEGAWIKASIISEERDKIRSYLEQGVKMGLSISGTCTYEDGSATDVIDWNLTEVSLTDMPCDQQTMGTVSISKNITDVIKTIKEETIMAEETKPAAITEEDVITIINDAINERKDEFLETIREELKNDAADLVARVEAIEAKLEEEKPEEEEAKAEDEEEEPKPEEEEEEKPKAEADEEEVKPEDEEEEKKAFQRAVDKAVDAKIKSIFGDIEKSVEYKYDSKKSEPVEKSTYTPAEIAKMI